MAVTLQPSRGDSCRLPLVAIVLINWNDQANTSRCLRSLSRSTGPATIVIVVDNGSTDGSLAALRRRFPAARFVDIGRNLGFAGGCNRGIAVALELGATHIWLLNNDTVVSRDAAAEMLRVMDETNAGVVGCTVCHFARPRGVQAWAGGTVSCWSGIITLHQAPAHRMDWIYGASIMARADLFKRVGLLDEGFFFMWEEVDWCTRAARAGWVLSAAPKATIWHVGSASLAPNNPRYAQLFARGLVRYMRKHSDAPWIPCSFWLLGKLAYTLFRGQLKQLPPIVQAWCEGWRQHLPDDNFLTKSLT